MKVLFVYPDFHVNKRPKGSVSYEPAGWYNEGLASLSAVLKRRGHDTALCHLLRPPTKTEFQAAVRRHEPRLVAFALRSEVFRSGAGLALWAKELGYTTIAGSYHPTLNPEESIASPGIDIVCLGEGEEPLAELCDRLESGRDPGDIPSLWLKREGKVIRNPVGPVVENLDDLPIPDFSLFNFDRLMSSQTYTALVSFTRGCPYNCTYCCNHEIHSLYPNRKRWLRSRSPQNAITYIRMVRKYYPEVRYLRVMDDIFHWREEWLAEFVPLYRAEFDMPLAVNHRPNLFSENAASLLREAGCYQVYFGVESGNEFIRKQVLHRHMTNDQIKTAFANARKAGMITASYNMVGLPFENMERALDTIKLNAQIGANRILNPIFCPYPNTDLYDIAVKEGFCSPKVDYEDNVVCTMPDFGEKQIDFVCTNFKLFVKLYRIAYRLPAFLGRGLEYLVDRLFLWPRLPYGALTKLANARHDPLARAKNVLRERTPNIYIFVRDRLIGNRL
ncbi:MAG: B12-binding domain-containing radical SAM protein [Chloroflexi bacterium]|nr:B12-binding domain-containing radical SAM protein [Chloroflexota bacterium]